MTDLERRVRSRLNSLTGWNIGLSHDDDEATDAVLQYIAKSYRPSPSQILESLLQDSGTDVTDTDITHQIEHVGSWDICALVENALDTDDFDRDDLYIIPIFSQGLDTILLAVANLSANGAMPFEHGWIRAVALLYSAARLEGCCGSGALCYRPPQVTKQSLDDILAYLFPHCLPEYDCAALKATTSKAIFREAEQLHSNPAESGPSNVDVENVAAIIDCVIKVVGDAHTNTRQNEEIVHRA